MITTKGRKLYTAAAVQIQFYSTDKLIYWLKNVNKTRDILHFFIARKISKNYVKLYEVLDLTTDH